MLETHRFIQGVFSYQGRGLTRPVALEPKADYIVPAGKRASGLLPGRQSQP